MEVNIISEFLIFIESAGIKVPWGERSLQRTLFNVKIRGAVSRCDLSDLMHVLVCGKLNLTCLLIPCTNSFLCGYEGTKIPFYTTFFSSFVSCPNSVFPKHNSCLSPCCPHEVYRHTPPLPPSLHLDDACASSQSTYKENNLFIVLVTFGFGYCPSCSEQKLFPYLLFTNLSKGTIKWPVHFWSLPKKKQNKTTQNPTPVCEHQKVRDYIKTLVIRG